MKHPDLSRLPPWAARALREPLVHFLIAGALIFALDAAVTATRGSESVIVVPAQVRKDMREQFIAAAKREPTPQEMAPLLARWTDNEILYREGLALGLDKGDPAMRERVIFKALNVVQAGVALPKIDEAGLQRWFEANRARYDIPARVDFDEAVPAAEATPEALRKFTAALNAGGEPEIESSLRVFKQRPRDSLVQAYGEDFAKALDTQVPGAWTVLASSSGWRAVRLNARSEGHRATFGEVRDRVYMDWKDDTSGRLTRDAVRALGRKYRIRGEEAS